MGAYSLRGNHLNLIARTHAKYSIRGGAGLVFSFITLVVGLIVAQVLLAPVELIDKEVKSSGMTDAQSKEATQQVLSKVIDTIGKPIIKWWTSADDKQMDYLTQTKPVLLSAMLVILLFLIPCLVSLGAFNQLSGDIQTKGLRYLLLRTERANLYVGRFIGTFIFTMIVLAALMGIVTIYMVAKINFYPAGDLILWSLQGYGALAFLALPYIALCSWISSAIDSPFGSMAITQMVVWFWPLLISLGTNANENVKYAGYVMPWSYKYWLLSPDVPTLVGAWAIMLAFTALFTFMGMRTFQTRDL